MMKLRAFFICVLMVLASSAFTQSKKDLEKYMDYQDSLMHKAYIDRNPSNYLACLNNFEGQYSKMSKPDKDYFKGNRITAFYNLGCLYSLLNKKKDAISYLKKSIEVGYSDYSHIQKDSDLDNIRKEHNFQQLLKTLRESTEDNNQEIVNTSQEMVNYLSILKRADKYNLQEKKDFPAFTYQDSSNVNLQILRRTFNLDSIAGNTSELMKIINLLHWVHNVIPHDGIHDNPTIKNAMSMIHECKIKKRGLNCRMLATILNECYLSMGIKSRFISCIPKDSTDTDLHVINMVYSIELQKWLWIDPTNNAYVMNEQGELLSIEEVRKRLILDKPLVLNPEANWNNTSVVVKEEYLYNYMAKNLYILQCPLRSEYDTETKENDKSVAYLELIPLDYYKKSLEKEIYTQNDTKNIRVFYKTNDPAFFWQTP